MKRKIHKQGSTAMAMRICGDRMKPCYDNKTGEKFKYLEVTEEILKMGLICIVEEQSEADKEGMAEATSLVAGNIIVFTNKGARCFPFKDFQNEFSF